MRVGRWLALIVLLAHGTTAFVQPRRCTKDEARAAEEVAGTLRNWSALHEAFKRYAPCDDGAIGEGFSDSVAKILAGHWSTLGELQGLAASDPAFLRFVLRHIDATVDSRELKAIVVNAAERCPQGANALCAQLDKAAQQALKDI